MRICFFLLLYKPTDGNNLSFLPLLRLTGGELFDYCVSKDYLMEGEAIMFLKQILDGLNYMHSKSVCHLDLKVSRSKDEVYVFMDKQTK